MDLLEQELRAANALAARIKDASGILALIFVPLIPVVAFLAAGGLYYLVLRETPPDSYRNLAAFTSFWCLIGLYNLGRRWSDYRKIISIVRKLDVAGYTVRINGKCRLTLTDESTESILGLRHRAFFWLLNGSGRIGTSGTETRGEPAGATGRWLHQYRTLIPESAKLDVLLSIVYLIFMAAWLIFTAWLFYRGFVA